MNLTNKLGRTRTAIAGLIMGLPVIGGCGIGAYSADPRAGIVVDEMAQGIWAAEVAERGRSNVEQNVYVNGNNTNQGQQQSTNPLQVEVYTKPYVELNRNRFQEIEEFMNFPQQSEFSKYQAFVFVSDIRNAKQNDKLYFKLIDQNDKIIYEDNSEIIYPAGNLRTIPCSQEETDGCRLNTGFYVGEWHLNDRKIGQSIVRIVE